MFILNRLPKRDLKGQKRNVICRNFPLKPQAVVSKINIKEGSDKDYLICASVSVKKKNIIFDCEKV